jgi:hypothetical protein
VIARALVGLHVVAGGVGLLAFWVAMLSRKGGGRHVRAGRVFEFMAYVVASTALMVAGLRVQQSFGIDAAQARGARTFAIFLAYLAVAIAAIVSGFAIAAMGLLVPTGMSVVMLALSPIGVVVGGTMLRHARRGEAARRWWQSEHVAGMIGAGIGFHTAFLVFGARSLFAGLPAAVQWVPWVLPSAVGVPAIVVLARRCAPRGAQ